MRKALLICVTLASMGCLTFGCSSPPVHAQSNQKEASFSKTIPVAPAIALTAIPEYDLAVAEATMVIEHPSGVFSIVVTGNAKEKTVSMVTYGHAIRQRGSVLSSFVITTNATSKRNSGQMTHLHIDPGLNSINC